MRRVPPLVRFFAAQRRALDPLLILTHNYPDPDAMASAFALAHLAHAAKIRATIAHGGVLGRMENRMMAQALRLPMRPLRQVDWERHRGIALVDTQPPFANNLFPCAQRRAAIVIDHHPRHADTRGDFIYIRTRYGATSTILTRTLLELRAPIPTRLASALAYGISSETQNLGREAAPSDIVAYRALLPFCDMRLLGRLQHPRRSPGFFQTIGRAIHHAFVSRRLIGVHLGIVETPDLVSQVADFLMAYDGMRWAICTGRHAGVCHVSLRTTNPDAEAGELLARVIQQAGRAGGHGMIAGGAVMVGQDASSSAWRRVERSLVQRLCQQLQYPTGGHACRPFRRAHLMTEHEGDHP